MMQSEPSVPLLFGWNAEAGPDDCDPFDKQAECLKKDDMYEVVMQTDCTGYGRESVDCVCPSELCEWERGGWDGQDKRGRHFVVLGLKHPPPADHARWRLEPSYSLLPGCSSPCILDILPVRQLILTPISVVMTGSPPASDSPYHHLKETFTWTIFNPPQVVATGQVDPPPLVVGTTSRPQKVHLLAHPRPARLTTTTTNSTTGTEDGKSSSVGFLQRRTLCT
jgi:hypothetical protein